VHQRSVTRTNLRFVRDKRVTNMDPLQTFFAVFRMLTNEINDFSAENFVPLTADDLFANDNEIESEYR